MTDRLTTADASAISGADFLRALTGKPPVDQAQRQAERDRYFAIRAEEYAKAKALTRLPDESALDFCTRSYAALTEAERRVEARWAEERFVDVETKQLPDGWARAAA